MLAPLQNPEPIECPKCHKHTVVRQSETVYSCINCSFHRDLSESEMGGSLVFGLLVFALIVVLL